MKIEGHKEHFQQILFREAVPIHALHWRLPKGVQAVYATRHDRHKDIREVKLIFKSKGRNGALARIALQDMVRTRSIYVKNYPNCTRNLSNLFGLLS